jgi:hypothetical protein
MTSNPIIKFIDRLVKKNELGQDFALMDHQREILRLAFAFDQTVRLPWDTIIYSCIKKSGKTTLNGAITLAWGFVEEAPNEILILANDWSNPSLVCSRPWKASFSTIPSSSVKPSTVTKHLFGQRHNANGDQWRLSRGRGL